MTQNTYTRIQTANAIAEHQRRRAEQREAAEMVTPFVTTPGTPIVSVDILRAVEPDEVRIALTLQGGAQEIRCMPNRRHTHALVLAYAQFAERGMFVESRANWTSFSTTVSA